MKPQWELPSTKALLWTGGTSVVGLGVVGFAWLGGEKYGGGLLVEATSLVFGALVLALLLDGLARARESQRWAVVRDLLLGRVRRELAAAARGLDAAIGLELEGRRLTFYESNQSILDQLEGLTRRAAAAPNRTKLSIHDGSGTPAQRLSRSLRGYISPVTDLGLVGLLPELDPDHLEALLVVEARHNEWQAAATWISTDEDDEAARALDALLTALTELARRL